MSLDLAPQAPWKSAAALLGAFFLAAVPLDGWLTRRALRRGRRMRLGALRFPAFALAATAAAFALTEAATGRDISINRIDIVDVGVVPEARAGSSLVVLCRGESGAMVLDSPGADLRVDRAAPASWDVDQGISVRYLAAEGMPSAAILRARPWDVLVAELAWQPGESPALIGPPESAGGMPLVPDCLGAAARTKGPAAYEWIVGAIEAGRFDPTKAGQSDDGEISALVHAALQDAMREPMPDGEPCDAAVVTAGSVGPELRIDRKAARATRAVTLVRQRYPEAVRLHDFDWQENFE